ncbi:MAG: hypothetical protein K0R57_1346 [Paenibacillaceae bacterium]|jgi:uncharacterized repeat protein (TIGR02543 family)|nr:hypothetical protein [Paenibacillaceae bacterium]
MVKKCSMLFSIMLLSVLVLAFIPQSAGAENNNGPDLSLADFSALEAVGNVHPRLYLDGGKLAAQQAKLADSRYTAYTDAMFRALDNVIAFAPPDYNPAGDVADGFLRQYSMNLANMAFAYKLTLDPKYLAAAEVWLAKGVQFPNWGRQPGAVNADLAAGHMLHSVSLVYDWCYSELQPATRQLVEAKLLEVGEDMYEASLPDSGAFWKTEWLQNHLWIDLTGLTAAGVVLYDQYPEAAGRWLTQARQSMHQAFLYLGDDGASHEGVMYWQYGTEWLMNYMDISRQYFGIDYYTNAFSAWFAKTADYALRFFLPEDSITNQNNHIDLADDDRNFLLGGGPSPNFSKLAMEYNNGYAQYYARMLREKEANVSHYLYQFLLRTNLDIPEQALGSLDTAAHFDDMDIISARSSWNGNESLLAFKSGPYMGHKVLEENNTSPYVDWGAGHVHPDQNHFSWFGGGDWLMKDDGYSYKYTGSHNTLLINGKGQAGEDGVWFNGRIAHDAAVNNGGKKSEIVKTEFTDDYDFMVGDATSAYPSVMGLDRYNRHLLYIKPDVLVVIDDIKLNQTSNLELRFFPDSQYAVKLADGSVLVQNPQTKLLVQPLDLDGGTLEPQTVTYWGGRTNIAASPLVSADRLCLVASKAADSWTSAVAVSYSPDDQIPPQITSQKLGDGLYGITVNGALYTVDIGNDTVTVPQPLEKTGQIHVTLDQEAAVFANPPVLLGNQVFLPLEETLGKTGKTVTGAVYGTTVNGVVYAEMGALRQATDTIIRWRDNLNALEIITEVSGDSPEASLAAVSVSGTPLAGFSPEQLDYDIHKSWQNEAGAVVSLASDLRAKVVTRFETDRVVITVTSADRQHSREYILHIIPYLGFGEIAVKSIASSGYNQSQIPELTMDEDLLSYWAAEGEGQYLQYELEEVSELGQVAIAHHQGQVRRALFKIEGSLDGASWTELFSGQSSGASSELEYYPVQEMQVKYIRITGYGNSVNKWNSYREVCFYGTDVFIKSFNLNLLSASLMEGEELALEVTAQSSDNQAIPVSPAMLTYEFSRPGIVDITDGKVRGLTPGTTDIKATLLWQGKTRSQKIAVTVYSNILFNSGFEDQVVGLTPTGWKINNNGGDGNQVSIGETDKGKGVKITFATGGANPSARYTLGNIQGEVTIEADFLITKTGGDKQIQLYDSEPRLFSYLADFAANGKIMIWNNAATEAVGAYEPNTWYRLKFEVDTDLQTFNVYINGVMVKENAVMRQASGGRSFDWSQGLTGFRIDAYSAVDADGEYVMDNLKISVPRYDERPEYTVSFDSNGGSELPGLAVKSGSYIREPAAPVMDRYVFDGWYKDEALHLPWTFGYDKVKKNVTLYAKWRPLNPVYLQLTAEGYGSVLYKGTDGLQALPWPEAGFAQGDIIVLEASPGRLNHFISWSGAASGSNPVISLTIDGDKQLGASFTTENRVMLDESFDGFTAGAVPTGWKFNNTGGELNKVAVAAADQGNGMKIVYATGGTNPSAIYDLGYAKGKVSFEGDFMAAAMGAEKRIQIYDSEPRLVSYLVSFQPNGSIAVYDGTHAATVGSYTAGTWYHVKVEVDTDALTYSLSINGVLIREQIALRVQASNRNFDWSNGLRQFRIDMYSATDAQGEFMMDNLLIYMPEEERE